MYHFNIIINIILVSQLVVIISNKFIILKKKIIMKMFV